MHPKSFVGRALPRPAGGAYSAPPDLLVGFKGAYFQGKGGVGSGGKGRGWKSRGVVGACLPTHNFWLRHWYVLASL